MESVIKLMLVGGEVDGLCKADAHGLSKVCFTEACHDMLPTL